MHWRHHLSSGLVSQTQTPGCDLRVSLGSSTPSGKKLGRTESPASPTMLQGPQLRALQCLSKLGSRKACSAAVQALSQGNRGAFWFAKRSSCNSLPAQSLSAALHGEGTQTRGETYCARVNNFFHYTLSTLILQRIIFCG